MLPSPYSASQATFLEAFNFIYSSKQDMHGTVLWPRGQLAQTSLRPC